MEIAGAVSVFDDKTEAKTEKETAAAVVVDGGTEKKKKMKKTNGEKMNDDWVVNMV